MPAIFSDQACTNTVLTVNFAATTVNIGGQTKTAYQFPEQGRFAHGADGGYKIGDTVYLAGGIQCKVSAYTDDDKCEIYRV